jgi:hypothetical protein
MKRHARWYDAREPITANVETGGPVHRVSWRDGRVILHDHDLAAEKVLLALGGEPCPCLLVCDAFRGPSEGDVALRGWQIAQRVRAQVGVQPVLGVQAVWQTGRPFQSGLRGSFQSGLRGSFQSGSTGSSQSGSPGSSIAQGVRMVLRSGGAVSSTLQGTAITARQQLRSLQADPNFMRMPAEHRDRILSQVRYRAAMEIVPADMAELLEEAAQVRSSRRTDRESPLRARPARDFVLQSAAVPAIHEAVRRSRAHLRSYGELTVKCWRQAPGTPAHIAGHVGKFGGFVSVSLCLTWLNRVWLRDLANVDGCFVLEVDAAAPATQLRGQAVRWERRAGGDSVPVAAACLLFKQGREWRLAWC